MPRKREEVAVHILHIDRHVRRALRAVDEDHGAVFVRDGGNLLDRIDEAKDVRDFRDGDDLRLLRDLLLRFLDGKPTVLFEVHVLQDSALRLGNHLPRHEVRVMLGDGDDDLVTRLDIRETVAVGDEVQRLRRVLREDDLLRQARVDEGARRGARVLVDVRRLDGERVRAPMRVRVAAAVIAADRLNDLVRLLRRRAVVEVDERLIVHLVREQGKILANVFLSPHLRSSLRWKRRSPP